MIKLGSKSFDRYQDGWWYIDVYQFNDTLEAWVTCKDSGVSRLMFGMDMHQPNGDIVTYGKFLEIVEANLRQYKNEEED